MNNSVRNRSIRRLLAMALSLLMVVGLLPVAAQAAEASSTVVTITTDTTNPDDNQISLREAIGYAGDSGTVTFASGLKDKTITLDSPIEISGNITVQLSEQTISSSGTVFQLAEGAALTLKGEGDIRSDGQAVTGASGTYTLNVDLDGAVSGTQALNLAGTPTLKIKRGTFTGSAAPGAIYAQGVTLTATLDGAQAEVQASSGGAWASAGSGQLSQELGSSSLQPYGLRMRPSNELAAPEGLSWDGDTAKWNAVTDATGYSVQLYKNGTEDSSNKVGSPVSATGTSHDFSATFQSEGDGTYYFAVQATGSKDSSLWSDPSVGHEVSKDTTAPTLSEGTVAYTSKTTAEGSFKTSEGGQYYIQAVASGEAAPTIDVSGAGTSCQAGTVSFTLDSLDGGAKDVYVVVKDSAGNQSDALKIELAAYVAKTYSVTLPSGEGYTAKAAEGSSSPVQEGGSFSFTVTVSEGYGKSGSFAVKANGTPLSEKDGVYTIESINADQKVTVEGVVKGYTVTFSEDVSYTIEPQSGSSFPVLSGGDYSFKVTLKSGYKKGDNFAVKANGVTLEEKNGVYTIENITKDQEVVVSGVANEMYTIGFSTDPSYTIKPCAGSTSPIASGSDYSFTVTLNPGYKKGDNFAVKANGVVLKESSGIYTIKGVMADQTITVSGVDNEKYTISFSTDVSYTIQAYPGSSSPISSGSDYSFTVTLKPGYKKGANFAVKANGVTLTEISGIYTIKGVMADQTITVSGVDNEMYTIGFSTDVSYTIQACTGSSSPISSHSDYSFTVTLKPGYKKGANFAVKANGVTLKETNGIYTIYDITENQNVVVSGVANEPATYTVKLPSGTGYTTTVTGGSSSPVAYGGSFSFTVNLAAGYSKGVGFTVKANNTILTPSNGVYTIRNITANQTVTVTGVTGGGTGTGTGTGGGTVPAAPSITTTSLPAAVMGTEYKQTISVTGATPITWSYTGKLPNGLALNTTTGVISGTPTLSGTYRFTLKASNSTGSATRQLTITVSGSDYQVTSGQNAEWETGTETGLDFTTDGDSEYVKTQVDGVDVAAANLVASDDGKTVTLRPAYLEKLTDGTHTVTIVYEDGSAEAKFVIKKSDPTVAPTITTQPVDKTVQAGSTATFSVTASGTTPLLCQWQVDKGDGSGWVNITGAVSASYTVETSEDSVSGYQYRCIVTNTAGEVTSDPAVLTIEGAASSASPDASPDGQKDPSESGGSLRWLWISILALTIVALVVVIVIYLKRRKEYME